MKNCNRNSSLIHVVNATVTCCFADHQDKPDARQRLCPRQHGDSDQSVQAVRELLQRHDQHQEGHLQPGAAAPTEGLHGEQGAGEGNSHPAPNLTDMF